jgi:hypothetical protein
MARVSQSWKSVWELPEEELDAIWELWKKNWGIKDLDDLEKETDGCTYKWNWENIWRA